MPLPPKQVQCACGHSFTSELPRTWCTQCGKPVYYDPKDQKKHKLNSIYLFVIFIAVVYFLIYVYIELLGSPFIQ